MKMRTYGRPFQAVAHNEEQFFDGLERPSYR